VSAPSTTRPATGISAREFARRDGCDEKLVRNGKLHGYLKAFPDGSLDPALVGTGWRETNRRRGGVADSGAPLDPTVRTYRDLPGPVLSLAMLALGVGMDAGEAALRQGVDEATARAIADETTAAAVRAVLDLVADDVDPPTGHTGWADHPLFTAAPDHRFDAAWSELVAEVAATMLMNLQANAISRKLKRGDIPALRKSVERDPAGSMAAAGPKGGSKAPGSPSRAGK
jgi:hypothetical protein